MGVWRIVALRRLRQLLGRSQDWREMPAYPPKFMARRDFVPANLRGTFVVEVPIKDPKVSKAEWEAAIRPWCKVGR